LRTWDIQAGSFVAAVNLPAIFFSNLDFPEHLLGMLNESDVPPSCLVIEVTERQPITKGTVANDVMTRLRLQGIGLAIDDFGLGHSSLSDLYRLPFSELKIDATFIRDIDAGPEAVKIVRALVGLTRDLEMTSCAEGVETLAQARILRNLGCDRAQGYLYGGAYSARHFSGLLRPPELS
jgi:EAL domain-containing protein (putative c-di-GMP-specific phosphodiesterase class I)